MRQERTIQASLFDVFAKHEIGCELKKISQWLDEHHALLGLVSKRSAPRRGARDRTAGAAGEAVLRCALLKQ